MIDVQGVKVFLGVGWDKVTKVKWSKLIPRFRVDRYPISNSKKNEVGWAPALGLELTWKMGPGIGVGLGLVDIWFGWPRSQENLHHDGCGHAPVAKKVPVDSLAA